MIKKIKSKLSNILRAVGAMPKRRLQPLLVLLILAAAIGAAVVLKLTRKPPAKKVKSVLAPLVKIQTVTRQDVPILVQGYGTVQAKVQAEVVPQVSGKVVAINPNFRDGGFVKANEALITIDPRDYELTVQRAQADVASAEVALDIEKAEAEVSRQEWEQLNPGTEPPSPLIVREPQIRQAQTRLQAAEAQLATAELNLERTRVSLPFDGRVVRETVDLGQYVMSGQSIGNVYSIEAVEIEVPLEDWELEWFNIPVKPVSINGNSFGKKGSEVEVIADFAGSTHIWQGHVVRTTGEIDKTSRMVSVVVEMPQPFKDANGRPPLVPGMFVDLRIKGKILKDALQVPRYAIRSGNQVWVINGDRLRIKQVRIARQDKEYAYVVSGLEDNQAIVVSALEAVTDGMLVRTGEPETPKDANTPLALTDERVKETD
ncbi:MAG: efflux RND transporter periplasmic adaptor subunit [Planctomycetota bacterium]|nr:MAG: efflux RND transporter periplasmic adaptor subunit [Planctomycetota bacterium]